MAKDFKWLSRFDNCVLECVKAGVIASIIQHTQGRRVYIIVPNEPSLTLDEDDSLEFVTAFDELSSELMSIRSITHIKLYLAWDYIRHGSVD